MQKTTKTHLLSRDLSPIKSVRSIGLTLVELLVVMAIVGLLLGLLLPATQSAREAGRRAACAKNLEQVCLALSNYEGARRALPMGARGSLVCGFSWWVELAPYWEQGTATNSIDVSDLNSGAWAMNFHVDGDVFDGMLCPSSSLPPLYPVPGGLQILMPHYVGISGASAIDGFPEIRVDTCCLPENRGDISGGGLLIPNQIVRFKQITDGLSNTMVVGECSETIVDAHGVNRRIDGGFPDGWPLQSRQPMSIPL